MKDQLRDVQLSIMQEEGLSQEEVEQTTRKLVELFEIIFDVYKKRQRVRRELLSMLKRIATRQ